MKFQLPFASLIFVTASIAMAAKPIQLSMEMKLNGKISRPNVIVEAGRGATIEARTNDNTGYRISALPSLTTVVGKKAVKINFEMSELGKFKNVSKPTVIVRLGERATIIQNGKDSL